eukprot:scaffold125112_cov57-Phaeocystis_antarctica.AAC.2
MPRRVEDGLEDGRRQASGGALRGTGRRRCSRRSHGRGRRRCRRRGRRGRCRRLLDGQPLRKLERHLLVQRELPLLTSPLLRL